MLNNPTKKIILTIFVLFLFKFGNTIPLIGIDQEALKKSFLEFDTKNSIMQIINMYAGGGGKTLLSPFSLGIIPFINASILLDLLTAVFPNLEKLKTEESGRRQINFYKKLLTLFLATLQSCFLIVSLKQYFYFNDIFNFSIFVLELITGSLIMVWLSNLIDKKGIGNGTSLIIFTNIATTFLTKNLFKNINFLEVGFLIFLIGLICISQMARINIPIVSARQLVFLENTKKTRFNKSSDVNPKDSNLSIRFNQAGIFPIIIASNLSPFFSFLTEKTEIFLGEKNIFFSFIYYLCIILFNYFYTLVFWDPEKISEQLRKASVSIVNITPGKQTISYLENVVRSSSIIGGIFLCAILYIYELARQNLGSNLLNQINISSLIILIGVVYELQKTLKTIYKTTI